jgi:hypothetical protein
MNKLLGTMKKGKTMLLLLGASLIMAFAACEKEPINNQNPGGEPEEPGKPEQPIVIKPDNDTVRISGNGGAPMDSLAAYLRGLGMQDTAFFDITDASLPIDAEGMKAIDKLLEMMEANPNITADFTGTKAHPVGRVTLVADKIRPAIERGLSVNFGGQGVWHTPRRDNPVATYKMLAGDRKKNMSPVSTSNWGQDIITTDTTGVIGQGGLTYNIQNGYLIKPEVLSMDSVLNSAQATNFFVGAFNCPHSSFAIELSTVPAPDRYGHVNEIVGADDSNIAELTRPERYNVSDPNIVLGVHYNKMETGVDEYGRTIWQLNAHFEGSNDFTSFSIPFGAKEYMLMQTYFNVMEKPKPGVARDSIYNTIRQNRTVEYRMNADNSAPAENVSPDGKLYIGTYLCFESRNLFGLMGRDDIDWRFVPGAKISVDASSIIYVPDAMDWSAIQLDIQTYIENGGDTVGKTQQILHMLAYGVDWDYNDVPYADRYAGFECPYNVRDAQIVPYNKLPAGKRAIEIFPQPEIRKSSAQNALKKKAFYDSTRAQRVQRLLERSK